MLRFAGTVTLLLFYTALCHCAPGVMPTEPCDVNSCNASCTKHLEGWPAPDAYGKCDEKGICRCYQRSVCDEAKCGSTCREKHGNEINLHAQCIDGVCTCKWNKKCQLSDCEASCKEVYAGKPNIEWHCEEDMCYCKWHGVLEGPAHGSPGGQKRVKRIQLVESDSFYLEKGVQSSDAKKAVQ
nr:uncharacterized protein LOC126522584 [Dermacentor andersoni]XP_054922457.1 uncharacterized protein LOC126522584 [Dermacentor andersoni]